MLPRDRVTAVPFEAVTVLVGSVEDTGTGGRQAWVLT